MKYIRNQFKKNGLKYLLIKRNELVAMYGVSGTFTEKFTHYEVCKILFRNDKYGYREALPSNEQFGRNADQCILDYNEALGYFDDLTNKLNHTRNPKDGGKSGILNPLQVSDIPP